MSDLESFRILIISEQQETIDELKKISERIGCSIEYAQTTEAGLELLKAELFDAVFVDLCVRSVGGRGVARMVKLFKLPVSVYIVTSWKGELEQSLLVGDGITSVIHKPLSFNEIQDLLNALKQTNA